MRPPGRPTPGVVTNCVSYADPAAGRAKIMSCQVGAVSVSAVSWFGLRVVMSLRDGLSRHSPKPCRLLCRLAQRPGISGTS